MPTINQLCRKKRVKKKLRNKVPALNSCPQKKGVCIKVFLRTPKKPNSALRKLVKLRLTNNKKTMAYGELKHSALEITLKLADQDLCH